MFNTIKAKFTTISVLFIVLIVGIPTIFLVFQFRENFSQRSEMMLNTTLDVVQTCLRNSMLIGDKNVQDVVSRFLYHENIENLRIVNNDGIILYSIDTTEINQSLAAVSAHKTQIHEDSKVSIIEKDGTMIYSVTRPIRNAPECMKCHTQKDIIAYVDIDTYLTQAERYFYTGSVHILYLAIVVILFLVLGFYFFFNRFINKPLQNFIEGFHNIEQGKLNTELAVKRDDEFGVLAKNFNRMVANLEKSKAEIEELHYNQLQRADKLVTLGELAAEIAHEINNPIAIILSRVNYLQMLSSESEELKHYSEELDTIQNQITKVSSITGNILKYSKKLPKDYKIIDLTKAMEETLKILHPRIEKYKISLKKNYEEDSHFIYGDITQIEQVFTNLINNAIDSMENGGSLEVSISKSTENILVRICDSGQGIDEYLQEQIFSPFFTTKSSEKGTGLGLYIVRNICKNHDVKIEFKSKPNEGTCFILVFKSGERVT
jgi:signal transduction histidine kinase